MPYIKSEKRVVYDTHIEQLIRLLQVDGDGVDGNTNYVISRIVSGAFGPNCPRQKWRYMAIARAMGCFVCAMFEFYRRVGARREDEVIIDNGDIPEYG